MGVDWRPGNVQPFPSRGPFGGSWNRHALRKCLHCGKATTLDSALHPWCEEAYREEVKRRKRRKKRQKKKEAQRAAQSGRSVKPTKAEWKRLKNLTMAEWQQEKKEQAERKRTEQTEREQ